MALCAAMLGAIGSNLYAKLGERLSSDMIGYVRMWLALPMSFVLMWLSGNSIGTEVPLPALLAILSSGFIGFFLCDLFMFKAIVDFGPRETAVVMTFNPVLTALAAFLLMGESLTLKQILGMAVTVIGIITMVMGEGKRERETASALLPGLLCAIIAAFLQTAADITAKMSLSDLPAVSSNALRVFGGFVAWVVLGFVKRKNYGVQMRVFADSNYLMFMILAVAAGPVLGTTLSLGAMAKAPVGIVKSIVNSSPVFMIPIDYFYRKKKLTFLSVAGTIISVLGVMLLF